MWPFIFLGIFFLLGIIYIIKVKVWDVPHSKIDSLQEEIKKLQKDIETIQEIHKNEFETLELCVEDLKFEKCIGIVNKLFSDIVTAYSLKELYELINKEYAFINTHFYYNLYEKGYVCKNICERFSKAIEEQYKYRYVLLVYPEISNLFKEHELNTSMAIDKVDVSINNNVFEVVNFIEKNNKDKIFTELFQLKRKIKFYESTKSNLTAIPYMAQIIADYETYGLEKLAKNLDWGYDTQRLKKVKSIREIRSDAKAMVEKNKEAQYQLAYLLELFPNLKDIIECDFNQLPPINVTELSEYDATKDYLSKEEYKQLSTVKRNQLALDRYKASHKKSKWQIGRDYELYIGHRFSQLGYSIDYFGTYMGLEDLGRDIIAKKKNITLIIQCKYWSSVKMIHEKHITQLYGTMMSYCIENNCSKESVKGVLITNITLSPMAKKMADLLEIEYQEKIKMGDYPCIKCNIGRDEFGTTKIYHLPFDQKYDETKINRKGEFFAMTVKEAEDAGFRRAFKWFGN